MSDPVFLTVTGTEKFTLAGEDPTALAPGRRVTLTIAGVEVTGSISYAEADVWAAGKLRVMVDGEDRTRIVDAADVQLVGLVTGTVGEGGAIEWEPAADFVHFDMTAIAGAEDTPEGRRAVAKATGAERVSVQGGPWCDADDKPIESALLKRRAAQDDANYERALADAFKLDKR